ncbi:MAG: tetratricopeptide repeat protein [Planctomycetota bacterium]
MTRQGFRSCIAALVLAGLADATHGDPSGSVAGLARQDPGAASASAPDRASTDDQELLAAERAECDLLRRRGRASEAQRRLAELLEETPADAEARALLARCLADRGEYATALTEARRALADAAGSTRSGESVRALCAREVLATLLVLGRALEARELAAAEEARLSPARDARDAWLLAQTAKLAGDRARWKALLESGAGSGADQPWDGLLARARCQRELGLLAPASESLVQADEVARKGEHNARQSEPDVLAALGDVYFEADREVEDAQHRSAASLYGEALRLHATHVPSLLGMHALHRYNWLRKQKSALDYQHEILAAAPNSIPGLLAITGADLDDGDLKSARERLAQLEALAPGRREVRTLRASLAFVEHDKERCEALLAELAREDAGDSVPERDVGRHLLELYRFAEGLPFVRRAVERDASDWEAWTQLGRALANTGDEPAARTALDRAQEVAGLRQDAWRNNLRLVLKLIEKEHVRETAGDLTFSWNPDAADVLRTYLVPFYTDARKELAERYGFTPGPTLIEVFARHRDFSVRSTGFEGFPALGVCFGPVVTSISPLCEIRGTFSWARTSFHEFTHVIHLGLSHNRCPRWITEGLATWEEEKKNPAWTRNMRRELLDARANGEIIPVRELNRAFRGPRILFGYYQGGLLCRMLIDARGFAPMIRLLEAFDRGLDLDQAFAEVFRAAPEEVDRDFGAFVDRELAGLRIEPRWTNAALARARVGLTDKPRGDRGAQQDTADRAWMDRWATVAWGAWQRGRKVDAQEALRVLHAHAGAGSEPPRALFLRGEMALAANDRAGARKLFEAAIAAGGDDFRARIALGSLAAEADDLAVAEQHFLAAEKCFPGYDERLMSAELQLVKLYEQMERKDDAMAARARWLAYESGDIAQRTQVAQWHAENGRRAESARLYRETNEIDPFLRRVHRALADVLRADRQFAEAATEYRVVLTVPPHLDAGFQDPFDDEERAEVLALQADCLLETGDASKAAELAREALALDEDSELAKSTLERLH